MWKTNNAQWKGYTATLPIRNISIVVRCAIRYTFRYQRDDEMMTVVHEYGIVSMEMRCSRLSRAKRQLRRFQGIHLSFDLITAWTALFRLQFYDARVLGSAICIGDLLTDSTFCRSVAGVIPLSVYYLVVHRSQSAQRVFTRPKSAINIHFIFLDITLPLHSTLLHSLSL